MLNVFAFYCLLDLCCFHLTAAFFFSFLFFQTESRPLSLIPMLLCCFSASIWLVCRCSLRQRAAGFECTGVLGIYEMDHVREIWIPRNHIIYILQPMDTVGQDVVIKASYENEHLLCNFWKIWVSSSFELRLPCIFMKIDVWCMFIQSTNPQVEFGKGSSLTIKYTVWWSRSKKIWLKVFNPIMIYTSGLAVNTIVYFNEYGNYFCYLFKFHFIIHLILFHDSLQNLCPLNSNIFFSYT